MFRPRFFTDGAHFWQLCKWSRWCLHILYYIIYIHRVVKLGTMTRNWNHSAKVEFEYFPSLSTLAMGTYPTMIMFALFLSRFLDNAKYSMMQSYDELKRTLSIIWYIRYLNRGKLFKYHNNSEKWNKRSVYTFFPFLLWFFLRNIVQSKQRKFYGQFILQWWIWLR